MMRLTALLLVIAATPAAAQQWSVDAEAGRIRSALDPSSAGYESAMVGVQYAGFNTSFRVSAGVPTRADQALWGSVAGTHRFAVRPGAFVAGLDVSGNAFALHDRVERTREIRDVFQQPQFVPAPAHSGYAAALQALPLVGFETSKMQMHVRAGVSRYTSEFAEVHRDRNVKLADAQLTFLPTSSFAIMPAIRHFIADESSYTYGGVTAVLAQGPLTLHGSAGRWLDLADQKMTWSGGAVLRVHERIGIVARARHDVLDPLYGTPGQTAWSVGASFKLGRVQNVNLAVPAVFDAGKAMIRLPVKNSSVPPRVAGDFTKWKPQPMQRDGDAWVYAVTLQPGVYNFAFVDDKGEWFVPENYPGRKNDGMGGVVAVLVVK